MNGMGTVRAWTENTAYRLLDGERLLLRLAPRMGKTYLSAKICSLLGESAIYIDGKGVTEQNQLSFREELQDKIDFSHKAFGSVQLVFDSFDRTVRLSQGPRLESLLVSIIIDGVNARDIGALFTARCSTSLHRNGAGSPLMSRVSPIDPPRYDGGDPKAVSWFGDAACLISRGRSEGFYTLADTLELDTSYISDIQSAAIANLRSECIDPELSDYASRTATHGLLTESGCTLLFERLKSRLLNVPADTVGWPQSVNESADKLASMIQGSASAIWSDRYMYRDVEPLRTLLKMVRARTDCAIQLLGAGSLDDQPVAKAVLARLTSIDRVSARFMHQEDYRLLHDRHIFTNPGGWVVPQVHVIVGKQRAGNATAARVERFPLDYRDVWRRSINP